MLYEKIPWKEYGEIAKDFNPVKFDADKWAMTAKNAGMKYLVITSKHHDGFAMFDSPSSDYNIKARTPYGKDPMKELVAACHKHGLKFGFYYSLGRDWQDPDVPTNWPVKAGRSNTWDFPDEDEKVYNKYFERKVKPQITELLTQYGPIDILWFDTPELISKKESAELRELILKLQPDCIINSRIGNNLGDYKVTEQEIVKNTEVQPWEACITMSRNWGYIANDTVFKSPELMVRQLLEIVSKGGNLLLNNGPTAEGEIRNEVQSRLELIGRWMEKNSNGIYGTHPWKIAGELLAEMPKIKETQVNEVPQTMKDAVNDATSKLIIPEVRFTAKDDDLFAYICSWSGKEVLIKSLSSGQSDAIKKVELLDSGKKAIWKQTSEGLVLSMPSASGQPIYIQGFRIKFQ
jgi:alpha-L-fucosidase